MNAIAKLNELERRILAILNEAGEECVVTLLNSVLRCSGQDSELVRFVTALRQLFESGLIEFADRRDDLTREWEVHAHGQETTVKLNILSTHLTWDGEARLWKWDGESPRLAVLLTENGAKVSHEILEKFGWEMTEPI